VTGTDVAVAKVAARVVAVVGGARALNLAMAPPEGVEEGMAGAGKVAAAGKEEVAVAKETGMEIGRAGVVTEKEEKETGMVMVKVEKEIGKAIGRAGMTTGIEAEVGGRAAKAARATVAKEEEEEVKEGAVVAGMTTTTMAMVAKEEKEAKEGAVVMAKAVVTMERCDDRQTALVLHSYHTLHPV
jgi:hypothetical protein